MGENYPPFSCVRQFPCTVCFSIFCHRVAAGGSRNPAFPNTDDQARKGWHLARDVVTDAILLDQCRWSSLPSTNCGRLFSTQSSRLDSLHESPELPRKRTIGLLARTGKGDFSDALASGTPSREKAPMGSGVQMVDGQTIAVFSKMKEQAHRRRSTRPPLPSQRSVLHGETAARPDARLAIFPAPVLHRMAVVPAMGLFLP